MLSLGRKLDLFFSSMSVVFLAHSIYAALLTMSRERRTCMQINIANPLNPGELFFLQHPIDAYTRSIVSSLKNK